MKSFAAICLISGALAAPFTDANAPRAANKGMSEIGNLISQAVSTIQGIEAKVQDAVKAGKTVDEIVPIVTGALGASVVSAVNVTVSGEATVVANAGLDLGATLSGVTGLLGGVGLGAGVGLDIGLDLGVGLDIGSLADLCHITGLLGGLLGSVTGLLGTVSSVPGLVDGAGGPLTTVLGGLTSSVPGLGALPLGSLIGN